MGVAATGEQTRFDVDDVLDVDAALAPWIDPDLRALVEDRFWAPIHRLTSLEAMVADPAFAHDPGGHIGMFSDHGPHHARDVAARSAAIGEWAFGPLVAERPGERAVFVTGVSVLLSLIHDVGMCTVPPVGRRLHAQYVAQLVASEPFEEALRRIVETDAGTLRSGLTAAGIADADLVRTAGEVLACAMAHSKSAVPAAALDRRDDLRRRLQFATVTALAEQVTRSHESHPGDGSFAWLTAPERVALADDVVDAIRIMRAADALRQRGTTLRTSSGFELVVDARTGRALAVLRSASRRSAFLVEVDKPISVGEANIRTAELGPDAVRFEFHRGRFGDPSIADGVAAAVAGVVDDIQLDVLLTFPAAALDIRLLTPDDDPSFATRVQDRFLALRPELAVRTSVSPGQTRATVPPALDWPRLGRPVSAEARVHIVDRMVEHGMRPTASRGDGMFDGVVVVSLAAGDALMAPDEDASFVAVALGDGLVAIPLGGYLPSAIEPWIPIGTIGVLRGHDRNALVTAERPVEVMVIPADRFLADWAEPFEAAELVAHLSRDDPR